jgi:hypothetical protein
VPPLALVVAVNKNLKAVAQLQRQLNAISIQLQSEHVLLNELLKSVVPLG